MNTTEPMPQIDSFENEVEGEGDFDSEVEEVKVDLDASGANHTMETVHTCM